MLQFAADENFNNDIVRGLLPDEIYNLAAQSHVGVSFETPYTANCEK
jgi:GDP-D-mannose dehydratase